MIACCSLATPRARPDPPDTHTLLFALALGLPLAACSGPKGPSPEELARIIEDKLEFAASYMYQASEEDEGIRAYSRYFRAGAHEGDVNSGRGDSHHSIYAGLNWYLCGQNSKVQVGVQYDTLDTPDGDASATTLWGAYRMYF